MASDNLSSSAAADDAVNGFTRPEMHTENLAGTVDSYDRHVFLCYKDHVSWPSRIEASDSDPLPKLLTSTLKARKNDFTVKTKITLCEAREEAGFFDGDVLVFPDMIKYRGLEESNVDSFIEDVLVNGKPWAARVPEVLTGSYVYVCTHGSLDVRHGVCGPELLINKLNEEIELRGLKNQISVTAYSHIDGHKYAGNVLVYSPGPDGKIMGHWYGYVTPNDIPDLLDQHIAKGEVIQKLWWKEMTRGHSSDSENPGCPNAQGHVEANTNIFVGGMKGIFSNKYYREHLQIKKQKELCRLVQGNLSIGEYTAKFERLAKFVPWCANKEHEGLKCSIFRDGLKPEIKLAIFPLDINEFNTLVTRCRICEDAMRVSNPSIGHRPVRNFSNPQGSSRGFRATRVPYQREGRRDHWFGGGKLVGSLGSNSIRSNRNDNLRPNYNNKNHGGNNNVNGGGNRQNNDVGGNQGNVPLRCGCCYRNHYGAICPRTSIYCFNCLKPDHIARHCPEPK